MLQTTRQQRKRPARGQSGGPRQNIPAPPVATTCGYLGDSGPAIHDAAVKLPGQPAWPVGIASIYWPVLLCTRSRCGCRILACSRPIDTTFPVYAGTEAWHGLNIKPLLDCITPSISRSTISSHLSTWPLPVVQRHWYTGPLLSPSPISPRKPSNARLTRIVGLLGLVVRGPQRMDMDA